MNQPQEKSKLITWAGYVALVLLLAIPISIFQVRSGQWQPGLALYAISCAGAAIVALLFVVLLIVPAYKNQRTDVIKRLVMVLPGTALLLGLLLNSGDYPPIHDISTDTLDPPVFVAAQAKRGANSNPLDVKPDTIAQQIQAYPGIISQRNSKSVQVNFEQALTVAKELGWEVHHQDMDSGTIEAVEATAIMNFKDDVVIRIRPDGEESVIDLRSVSRVGVSDIGANSKRIRSFQKKFAAQ